LLLPGLALLRGGLRGRLLLLGRLLAGGLRGGLLRRRFAGGPGLPGRLLRLFPGLGLAGRCLLLRGVRSGLGFLRPVLRALRHERLLASRAGAASERSHQGSGSASELLHEPTHPLPEPLDVLAEGPDRLQDRFFLPRISGGEEVAFQLLSRSDGRSEILAQLFDLEAEEAVASLLFPGDVASLAEPPGPLPERAAGSLGAARKNF